MSEYVYILTNPAIPAWVKIGKTNDLERRLKDLFNTSVPFRFRVSAYLEMESNAKKTETAIHRILEAVDKKLRAVETDGAKREFFALSEDTAYEILRRVAEIITSQGGKAKLITPPLNTEELREQEIANRANIRSAGIPSALWLKWLGISDDDELTCTKPDKDGNAVKIKAKRCAHGVYGEWQGEEMPLLAVFREICGVTKSAEKFLTDAFDADKTAMGERLYSIGNVRATTRVLWFWKHNDRTLLEIYAERIAQESEEQGE